MRRLFQFFIPTLVAVTLAVGLRLWLHAAPTVSGPVLEVAWEDLDTIDTPALVRVPGMAHYTATVHQRVPGNLFRDAKEYWLYGYFAPYDTESRGMRVLVRSPVKPESLVSYELVTITGVLTRATPDKVSWETEVMFGRQSDYFFTDDMLLLEPLPVEPSPDQP